jgi:hypothetical protein
MCRYIPRALIGVLAAFAVVPAVATAAESGAVDLPTQANYGSGQIHTNFAMAMGLSCNLIGSDLTCYDSQDEALRAGAEPSASSAPVTTAATCSPPMSLYAGTSFVGSQLNVYTQSVWINLSGYAFDNVTSSWKTGCVGGYMANGTYGTGTTVGMPANNSQASLGSFNNLASSVKRCPC